MSPAATRSRGAQYSALATLAALATVAGHATATPPLRTASGAIELRSIAGETWLAEDGTRQHQLVRGRDARPPVVLFVHGGPGASELAARHLDALRAPTRRLVWLEPSAHDAPLEEPERFHAALLEAVAAAG